MVYILIGILCITVAHLYYSVSVLQDAVITLQEAMEATQENYLLLNQIHLSEKYDEDSE